MKRTWSSFEDVLHAVQIDEDLRLQPKKVNAKGRGILEDDPGYDCSHMSTWRWMSNSTIFVPGMGNLITTKYAERAAANKIGFKADVFLEPIRHNPKLVQQSLQPSVNARREDKDLLVKVVARKFPEGKAPLGVDGMLRGVVSPTYGEIRDAHVLRALQKIGGKTIENMLVSARRTDEASYFTFVDRELQTLPVLTELGDDVLVGFKFWNSEVGHHKLQFDAFLERILCTNGLVVVLGGENLLSRRHTRVDEEELERMLEQMWSKIPAMQERVLQGTAALHEIPIEDPVEEVATFLARAGEPKYIQEAARKAFEEEPIDTAYGVLQAISRLAVVVREDADRRLKLQQCAGRYLAEKLAKGK